MRFIGIDIHYDNIVVAYLNETGKSVVIDKIYLSDEIRFNRFLAQLSLDDYLALEASTNSFWFYDQVIDRVQNCLIINPGKFLCIANAKKKNDKIDAKKIARKLRYHILCDDDPEEFPTVYVPDQVIREIRSLFTSSELLKKQKTALKNRIFSLFVETMGRDFSKELDLHAACNREAILNIDMPISRKIQIEVLYMQIDSLTLAIDKIKMAILKAGSKFMSEIEILTSVPGISAFTAIAILADIADINRFDSPKKLASYLRTAPTIDSSNNTQKIGRVNKQSRRLALKMLLQGLTHIYKSSDYLYNFYIRKKKGKKAGKVRIAISRKVFTAIYHMLKNNIYFYWTKKDLHDKKMKQYIKKLAKMKESA